MIAEKFKRITDLNRVIVQTLEDEHLTKEQYTHLIKHWEFSRELFHPFRGLFPMDEGIMKSRFFVLPKCKKDKDDFNNEDGYSRPEARTKAIEKFKELYNKKYGK